MGNTCPIHFEAFKGPVPSGDGPHETGRDEIPGELHGVESVEFGGSGRLF